MFKTISWMKWVPLLFVLMATGGLGREYVIFTISQEISMGDKVEDLKKNFYVNLGKNQGLVPGTLLDVYRIISKLDPYNNYARYNYKVKIGELKVIHADENAAIAENSKLFSGKSAPLLEISDFMIGDQVSVHIDN